MTANHVLQHQGLAAIGYVHHAGVGHPHEHHGGEMGRGAVALGPEGHLAGIRLDVVDQLLAPAGGRERGPAQVEREIEAPVIDPHGPGHGQRRGQDFLPEARSEVEP